MRKNHEEQVLIVDRDNNVTGAAPRSEMRAGRLGHRAAYILVFNSRGELFVQQRTMTKDTKNPCRPGFQGRCREQGFPVGTARHPI